MTKKASFRDIALPLVVFPAIAALACNFIFGHLAPSGLAATLDAQCSSSSDHLSTPYRLNYTGLPALDGPLCGLVNFFHITMDEPLPLAFLSYFIGVGGPFIIIPAVEAARSPSGFMIAYPLIWGLLSQTITIGVTLPLYWLAFISTGLKHRSGKGQNTITQAHAEAIVFGVVIGAVVPSVAMLVLRDPQVTAIWQAYPIYVASAQALHMLFRPPSQYSYSGYPTIRAFFLATFITSSSLHLSVVWPLKNDIAALKAMFLPSTSVLSLSTPIHLKTLDFLKWDFTFGFSSMAIGTLWFANSVRQFLGILAWYLLATPIAGPGAAVMGVILWRESKLV